MADGLHAVHLRREELLGAHAFAIHRRTDRLFAGLLAFQWAAGILAALVISPHTWIGAASQTHLHVYAAVLLGALISGPPIALAIFCPGRTLTRHSIALGQAATSALLIHLSGGRIETHFHVFGSLAFLAFYRDWRVIMTATAVVAADHLLRGVFWPQSVFGVLTTSHWRWAEHAGWVVFEDIFLIHSCIQARREMVQFADQRAALEFTKAGIEEEVEKRTAQLMTANAELEHNIAERVRATEERERLELQLQSAQKLEAVGQLAAGIAHEINTPTQYVGDNTRFLKECFEEIGGLLGAYDRLAKEAADGSVQAGTLADVERAVEEADPEYLRYEIPKAIDQSLEGVGRVSSIVRAMKEFSHPGVEEMTSIDLNNAIRSTATVCRNEWKYCAELELDLDAELPQVPCLPGEVNQVFLNIIVNAAHAIADRNGGDPDELGRIRVSSRQDGECVEVRIEDTGGGIPEDVRSRIFDPFFTTKGVGKGTGQGLAIAHSVIVKKHRGSIAVECEDGVGSTFFVRLPLVQREGDETPCQLEEAA
ncbi:MAG: ATP-binding protein [Planctomycetota bacterium]